MRLVAAACLACATAALLAAQVPADQQKPTFKAGVNFVRVDVYPTVKGRAVAGLTRDDFEVREDGVPQRIDTFDYIEARRPGPESERAEPKSQEEANRAAGDPRTRLFVVYFDTLHTAGYSEGEMLRITHDPASVGRALASFLSRMIGPDDLVGLMVPEMRAETITFTRRPSSFDEFLRSGAGWQQRFLQGEVDETERNYQVCYPPGAPDVGDFAWKMIARRREMLTLDGLRNLVSHLDGLREGRKAVLAVSLGWTLYRPDSSLERPRHAGVLPQPPPIAVDKGKLTLGDPRDGDPLMAQCERDRMLLARIDNERDFRTLLDAANRANVTFYPIDPRGLTVESTMTRKFDSLVSLATSTDGIPIINSNDFTPGLNRVAADLSAYYLLGYNSTNTRTDGRFRSISVQVKRPGVTVRARRGYLATTPEAAVVRARSEAAAEDPELQVREQALATLGVMRADRPLHIAAGYVWLPGLEAVRPVLWVAGEIDFQAWRRVPWSSGADASITVTAADDKPVGTEQVALPALSPRFLLRLSGVSLTPGEYIVRAKVRPRLGAADEVNEVVHLTVPALSTAASGVLTAPPILYRRGPFTGAGYQPTADVRFRKAERLRADVPLVEEPASLTARLLDRKGQVLPIPVIAQPREDSGVRFASVEIALAPLAQADYLIEIAARTGERTERRLIPFRVVP